jgi:hypothetical protein
MTDMIERVARAIRECEEAGGLHGNMARAAVAALREPSEAMLQRRESSSMSRVTAPFGTR